MNRFTEKFSVYLVGAMFGLTVYAFWSDSFNNVHLFVFKIYSTMTENWFLVFAAVGGLLLYYINTFIVFFLISAAYIFFLSWPDVQPDHFIGRIENYLGDITPGSVMLSSDAFRVYAMLIVIAFLDVLNQAYARTKEGDFE